MAMTQTARITRNWGTTFGYLAGGLVALALSVLLFKTIADGAITIGIALLPGILGAILLYMSVSGAAEAPCPACGAKLTGLSTGSNDGVLCEKCKIYVQGQGALTPTDPARVADVPLFTTLLPDQFAWPDGCCVCGTPATHGVKIEARTQNQASAAAVVGVTEMTGGVLTARRAGANVWSVEVPHCANHKDGALLASAGGDKVKIRFRSYPYLRAFCERNGTSPS